MNREGIIHVVPIKRHTWLPEGHDGEIRYTNCAEFLTVQMSSKTRTLETGLNEEEEEVLEKELRLEKGTLSKHNIDYWSNYKNTISISRDGLDLDLRNPKDYIIYKNLLVNAKVAPSYAEIHASPEFEYVITSPEQEAKSKNAKNKVVIEATKAFGKLSHSEMRDVLKLKGKRVAADSDIDFIEAKCYDIIESDPDEFLRIVGDKDFKIKVFVQDCIANKVITKSGPKYMILGGDLIGTGIEETIAFLQDPTNQDIYKSLKAKISV